MWRTSSRRRARRPIPVGSRRHTTSSGCLKNRRKLFIFLDYDGVPWCNNNGEHAVKAFASRRKAMGKVFKEDGIQDYLLLLSIYQTLRYRNVSFWQFLQTGETDIEAFLRNRR